MQMKKGNKGGRHMVNRHFDQIQVDIMFSDDRINIEIL
jgi:hypothetical protein